MHLYLAIFEHLHPQVYWTHQHYFSKNDQSLSFTHKSLASELLDNFEAVKIVDSHFM